MCLHFFNFDHLRIKLQSSDHFWGTKFHALSLLLPPFIFSYLQALIHDFLWLWASSRLIFSLKWHLQSSFSFSISMPLKFKKQRIPLIKKIQGLQAPHGATSVIIAPLPFYSLPQLCIWFRHCLLQRNCFSFSIPSLFLLHFWLIFPLFLFFLFFSFFFSFSFFDKHLTSFQKSMTNQKMIEVSFRGYPCSLILG